MTIKVSIDSREYFDEIFQSIQSAQREIDVEMYIFDLDELGLKFLDYLLAASKRGVKVRLLLDGVGSYGWTNAQVQKYQSEGLEIRFYHPISLKHLYHLNRRNHRKVILIDHKILFSGSINVSSKVLSWHETGVVIQSSSLGWAAKSFEWLWKGSPIGRAPSFRLSGVRTTLTRRMRRKSNKIFFEQMRNVKSSLSFVTPYLNLNLEFIYILFRAARRRVNVSFLLPQESDVKVSKYLNRAYYALLLGGGIRIFEYTPKVLHSKVSIIDDVAWVGSSNLNQRSFIHDQELDFLITDKAGVEVLKSRLLYDLQNSTEITLSKVREWGFFGRLWSEIVYWFRRYL